MVCIYVSEMSLLHLEEWSKIHLEYRVCKRLSHRNYCSRVYFGFTCFVSAAPDLVINLPHVFLAEANEKQMFTSGKLVLVFTVAVQLFKLQPEYFEW